MKAPMIYISGPITGHTAWEAEQNIRHAESASVRLFQAGVTNICVHSQSRFMDGVINHYDWLQHDFNIMRRCDAVYLCTNHYKDSRGTLAELEFARENNIPVYGFDDFASLVTWATKAKAGLA